MSFIPLFLSGFGNYVALRHLFKSSDPRSRKPLSASTWLHVVPCACGWGVRGRDKTSLSPQRETRRGHKFPSTAPGQITHFQAGRAVPKSNTKRERSFSTRSELLKAVASAEPTSGMTNHVSYSNGMQSLRKEHLYKVLVIGDLGVGKTSIIRRYVQQTFSTNYRATIGVDFALKVLNWDSETVRLQLWDIAGGTVKKSNMFSVFYCIVLYFFAGCIVASPAASPSTIKT